MREQRRLFLAEVIGFYEKDLGIRIELSVYHSRDGKKTYQYLVREEVGQLVYWNDDLVRPFVLVAYRQLTEDLKREYFKIGERIIVVLELDGDWVLKVETVVIIPPEYKDRMLILSETFWHLFETGEVNFTLPDGICYLGLTCFSLEKFSSLPSLFSKEGTEFLRDYFGLLASSLQGLAQKIGTGEW